MLFQALSFLLLCGATLGAYWRFPAARLWTLAIANALFYAVAGAQSLTLFLGASALTYALGRHAEGPWGRACVALGVALNLANLALFKYAGFIGGALGLGGGFAASVVLPIGISFYTFQHISYLVDRRRTGLAPAASYLHFWVYISFFGHSIAGPIMRGHEFFPQIARATAQAFDAAAFRAGGALFAVGLIKKLALADRIAPYVDAFFKAPAMLSTGEAWAAASLFTFQIYYDFSAYSDMAVGIGLMFGFRLRQNFRTPYVAAGPGEFWRRWHVTLSEWIRDYVYIPLGGNRGGVARAQANLLLAMLASGLWHGANWTFVLWGAWHGALLVAERLLRPLRGRLGRPGRALGAVAFGLAVVYGWVLFRAPTIGDAAVMMVAMANPAGLPSLLVVKSFLALAAALYALHWLEWALRRNGAALARRLVAAVPPAGWGLATAGLVLAYMLDYGGTQDFIYFQF